MTPARAARARTVAWLALVLSVAGTGCEAVRQSLDGIAAPLKEPELPNCSKVLTCCANLTRDSVLGPFVADTCETIVTPTDLTITNYQAAKLRIQQNTATSAQTKAQLIAELRVTTQETVEPACRCFVEETIGNVSLDGFLSPKDCEVVLTSGALPAGKQCDDVTDVILNPPN